MLETVPCLAQAIAQRKKIPHLGKTVHLIDNFMYFCILFDLNENYERSFFYHVFVDPDYLELVESQKIELNEFKIQYNDDQQHAVQKALRSSFSLIQGPPGISLVLLFRVTVSKNDEPNSLFFQ